MKFNNKNISIGQNVQLGQNVRIGDNAVIYDNVIIGDNSVICENCVIGEPLMDYYTNSDYQNPETRIGDGALIRSYTIIYAGNLIGCNLQTGHRVSIRENTQIGNNCSFGSYNDIQGFCTIGNYTRFQSFVNVGQYSEIGDYVFIYPYTVLTNDPTPPSNDLVGVKIGDYSQIASSTVMLPGCTIGKHSFVGANSTCGGQFEDDSFISGSPAKRYGNLSKMPLFNKAGKRHYPWPYNFERGMPWKDIGFEQWQKENK